MANAHYEAAKTTRRTAGWLTRSTGPNSEIQYDLVKLRNRHRDLARNNPWARRAIAAIVNNTIGSGIVAQWKTAKRHNRWRQWFETTDIDADGRANGYGLQSLILRTVVESGECLIRRRPRRMEDGFNTPLQIQVIEPDYLDHLKNESALTGGRSGYIAQGIEYNAVGQRTAYWIFPEHPGDPHRLLTQESVRYQASDFLHLYRADRPGQVRGVPWGTGAMLRLRMLDDYQDAQLERARLSACYMAFVTDPNAPELAIADEYELLDKLEPGAIEILPPGKAMTFSTPPAPEDDKEFILSILRACGADYGVPYEILTGDLSEVNFSSARMGWNEFARSIDVWRWQLLAPQLLNPLTKWFLQAELAAGQSVTNVNEQPLWTPPARTMVDPAREIPALQAAVRAGFVSLPQAIRQQGYDPLVLAEEQAAFLTVLDGLGVRFDSDGRFVQGHPSGETTQPQQEPEPQPKTRKTK